MKAADTMKAVERFEVERSTLVPDQPMLSICIPTYNRAPYLRKLLPHLVEGLAKFPHAVEIVVSDNASTDETPTLLSEFLDKLPLRILRHAENRGAYPNLIHALSQGRGTFLVYQADDDFLLYRELAALVSRLVDSPCVGVAYAPWERYDLVDAKSLGNFYGQPDDILVRHGNQRSLLEHVLQYGILPEIAVIRREAWHAMQPRVNELAYWAFVDAANYVGIGDVLLCAKPFYRSVSRYFEGPTRVQLGNEETEVAWDRYRGGLEYMLSRAANQLTAADRAQLLAHINQYVALRIQAALRFRIQKHRDAVDTWYLACRLRGLGHEKLLPMPLQNLGIRAAIWFIAHGEGMSTPPERIAFSPSFPENFRPYLKTIAGERVLEDVPEDALTDCVLIAMTEDGFDAMRRERLAARNVRPRFLSRIMVRFQP